MSCQELRANTEVKVVVGPVVAVGDGFTPVTTLALSTADEAEIMKHNAAGVTDIAAATFAAIASMDGYYNLTITAALADTEGLLVVGINDDSLCLPVKKEFMVLSEAAWDSKYIAKDDGFMDVNIKTVGRADTQETEANNLESACANYSATRGLTGTAVPAAAANAAGGLPVSTAGALDLDAKLAATNEVTAARMGALTDWVNGGRLDLILDIIAADTTTDIPATLATIAGYIDTEVAATLAAVDTEVAAILADTNELQTDWANAGRLDAILDIIAADTTTDIPALIAAAEAKIDIIDTNVDQIETTVITNAAGVDIAADIIAIKAETAAILEDTGTTLSGQITTIAADTTTDIPALIVALPTDADVNAACDTAISDAALATAANLAFVKTKTDYLPSATAGAAGGVFIAGANAATSITTALTANLTGNVTGNLSGSVGSVTGNVGGSVASVTDKAGFSLSATGADLILKSSTFIQAIVAAINEFATYGLTALNTLLVTTGIKAATIPAATLADDAITSGKFDETTAFPLKSADTGATAVARTGADADTLKTLSDEIDVVPTVAEIWAQAMSDLATGAPSATASVLTAINYLYEAWRNKSTTTASLLSIKKDDGITDLCKSTISDDATTFTKEEFVSGV